MRTGWDNEMNIGNILNAALKVIGSSKLSFRKFARRSVDEFGIPKVEYGEWKHYKGCAQPGIISSFGGKNISEKDYKEMGLDWTKSYITVWIPENDIKLVYKQDAADQILYSGKVYNIIQSADWIAENGWKRCYCVERTDAE